MFKKSLALALIASSLFIAPISTTYAGDGEGGGDKNTSKATSVHTIELRVIVTNGEGASTTNAHICMGETTDLFGATDNVLEFGKLKNLLTDANLSSNQEYYTLHLEQGKEYQLLSLNDNQELVNTIAVSTKGEVSKDEPLYVYLKSE